MDADFVHEMKFQPSEMVEARLLNRIANSIKEVVEQCLNQFRAELLVTRIWKGNSTNEDNSVMYRAISVSVAPDEFPTEASIGALNCPRPIATDS